MLRKALRSLLRTALVLGAVAAVSAGCSRQAEGERCDYEWAGDQDCDDGLICIPCGDLISRDVDRCCPIGNSTDARCARSLAPTGVACSSHHADPGSGGTGGTSPGDGGGEANLPTAGTGG
jgi:hypothetical protein